MQAAFWLIFTLMTKQFSQNGFDNGGHRVESAWSLLHGWPVLGINMQASRCQLHAEHYFLSYLLHSRWQKLVRVDGDEDDDDADVNSNR